ncbi:MAG TPA: hypothetical protein VGD91_18215 [Trebonia sp.]
MSGEARSFSHVSCHIGDDWQVRCSTYEDTTPILSLVAGPATVSLSTKGKEAGAGAVEFARALAREARRFLEEMERMRAEQLTAAPKAAGTDAA